MTADSTPEFFQRQQRTSRIIKKILTHRFFPPPQKNHS